MLTKIILYKITEDKNYIYFHLQYSIYFKEMSSRVLKKLGLQGATDIPKLEEESESDENISNSNLNKKKFNRYDLVSYLRSIF